MDLLSSLNEIGLINVKPTRKNIKVKEATDM